ncbi:MAG: hypothetical protein QXL40_05685 [Nitrososphaerota archaeon]
MFNRIIENGYLGWLLQRVTVIILFVCGAIHILYIAFTVERIPPNPFIFYSILLSAGVYHALNGLKTVLAEWGYGLSRTISLNVVFFIIGIVIWLFGVSALYMIYG